MIALVTGANKGIGLEIARQLGAQGYTVLVGARDAQKGEEAASQLRENGANAHAVTLDVSSEESVNEAARDVESRFGALDVLVNNAGANFEFAHGTFTPSALTLDDFKRTYDTNVFGAFSTIKAFLPLLKNSSAGRVVNVSSTLGSLKEAFNEESQFHSVNTLAYNSSKTALNAITVAFAKELANTNVKVNSACPGWVKTDMGSDQAPREVSQGASEPVRLATLPADGPTGGFFDENGRVAW